MKLISDNREDLCLSFAVDLFLLIVTQCERRPFHVVLYIYDSLPGFDILITVLYSQIVHVYFADRIF